jgi:hypothetical protein
MIGAVLLASIVSANTARAIAIAPRERSTWTLLELPQRIDPGLSGNYDDLRIVDDRGTETPYVLDPQCATQSTHQATLSDVGFVKGRYTQALLDAGNSGTLYSGISIDSPLDTYFDRVDVAISDDRVTWREVRNDALIYRVADSSDPGSQTIVFSPARARWIRVRVNDAKALFPIDAATIALTDPAAPQVARKLDATQTFGANDEDRTSIVTLDLGTPNTSLSWMRFRTSQAEFSRDVSIQTSEDGENWNYVADGQIERFAHGAPVLDVPVQTSTRYVRAAIANGNDAALPNLSATLFGPRRVVVFVARPGRSYALTRAVRAQAPTYDLGALLEHDNPRTFAIARLSGISKERAVGLPAELNQPWILTVAFTVVIVSLGAVTLSTLRRRS